MTTGSPLHRRPTGVALILALALAGAAEAARGIRSIQTDPIAARGGVLMIPLAADDPSAPWPATIDLELDDRSVVPGTVAWIAPRPIDPRQRRRWTDPFQPLAIRAIEPDDAPDPSRPGRPFLLARLPADGAGTIRLGRQTLQPRWTGVPGPLVFGGATPRSGEPSLPAVRAADRPDPDDPFVHWRWVLLADRLGRTPPSPDRFPPLAALAAEHDADLWRIALGRLASSNPGVASACVDWLTRSATDGTVSVATWVADPARWRQLRSDLLRPIDAEDLARRALGWIEACAPILAWTDGDDGAQVSVAVINRSPRPAVLRLSWDGAEDVPLAVEIPPGSLERIQVDRPRPPRDDGPAAALRERLTPSLAPTPTTLVLAGPSGPLRLTFGPAATTARPPGAPLGLFRAAFTLAEVELGQQRLVPMALATSAHVRYRASRWELFVECRRPVSLTGPGERLVVLIGPTDEPRAVLTVPEQGAPDMTGSGDLNALEIARGSFPDRWFCRIVLPVSWVDPREPLLVGVERHHAGGDAIETSPGAGPPWRHDAGRAVIRLDGWWGAAGAARE